MDRGRMDGWMDGRTDRWMDGRTYLNKAVYTTESVACGQSVMCWAEAARGAVPYT